MSVHLSPFCSVNPAPERPPCNRFASGHSCHCLGALCVRVGRAVPQSHSSLLLPLSCNTTRSAFAPQKSHASVRVAHPSRATALSVRMQAQSNTQPPPQRVPFVVAGVGPNASVCETKTAPRRLQCAQGRWPAGHAPASQSICAGPLQGVSFAGGVRVCFVCPQSSLPPGRRCNPAPQNRSLDASPCKAPEWPPGAALSFLPKWTALHCARPPRFFHRPAEL